MASRPAISSIAMALAGNTNTASVDIPNPKDTRHAAGPDGLLSPAHDQPASRRGMLPTPPGSISPSIQPFGFKHRNNNVPDSPTSAPAHVDSDMDLQEDAQGQPLPLVAGTLDNLASLESAGAITPGMLAKYHLPEILVSNGPLAIRHIMGYLTTNVPGFSGIAPAKARRLVVAALEGKGTGTTGGGMNGDVQFEKVGWGRWDAKRHGHARSLDPNHATPPSSIPTSLPRQLTGRRDSAFYGSSMTAESVVFSHSNFGYEDSSMFEHEADKMSLDGDDDQRRYCSSEASDPDELMDGDWGEADLTDEEDWAQIGAAALRARSFPHASDKNVHWRNQGSGGGPSYATLTKSVPGQVPIQPGFPALQDGGNAEERAAVEALLKLGSM